MFRICLVISRPDATTRSGSDELRRAGGIGGAASVPAQPGTCGRRERPRAARRTLAGLAAWVRPMGQRGECERRRAHPYILDEPISLHFDDVRELLGVFGRLVDSRNRSRKRCLTPLAGEQHPGPIAVAPSRHDGRNDKPGGRPAPTDDGRGRPTGPPAHELRGLAIARAGP